MERRKVGSSGAFFLHIPAWLVFSGLPHCDRMMLLFRERAIPIQRYQAMLLVKRCANRPLECSLQSTSLKAVLLP